MNRSNGEQAPRVVRKSESHGDERGGEGAEILLEAESPAVAELIGIAIRL